MCHFQSGEQTVWKWSSSLSWFAKCHFVGEVQNNFGHRNKSETLSTRTSSCLQPVPPTVLQCVQFLQLMIKLVTVPSYPLWASPQPEAADQADPPFSLPPAPRLASVPPPPPPPAAPRPGGSTSRCRRPRPPVSAEHLPPQIPGRGTTAEIYKDVQNEDKTGIPGLACKSL